MASRKRSSASRRRRSASELSWWRSDGGEGGDLGTEGILWERERERERAMACGPEERRNRNEIERAERKEKLRGRKCNKKKVGDFG